MEKLPTIGDNRTVLIAIIASAIPLVVIAWAVTAFWATTAFDGKDVAVVIGAIAGPLGYLVGRRDRDG